MSIPVRPGLAVDLAVVRNTSRQWLLTVTFVQTSPPITLESQNPVALFKESEEDDDEDAKITGVLTPQTDTTKMLLQIFDTQTKDLLDGAPLPGGLLVLPYAITLQTSATEIVHGNLYVYESRVHGPRSS